MSTTLGPGTGPPTQIPHLPAPSREPATSRGRSVRLWKAVVVGGAAALLVAAAASAGTYAMSDKSGEVTDLQREVATLTTKVGSLEATVADQTSSLETLQAQNATLTATNTALRKQLAEATNPRTVYPNVSFGAAVKDASLFTGSSAYFVVVDVTVTNPDATHSAFFVPGDVRLKSLDGRVFPILDQSPVASQPRFRSGVETLPGGRVQLQAMDVRPGETAKGSLVFYVTDPKITTFTVSYRGGATTTLTP